MKEIPLSGYPLKAGQFCRVRPTHQHPAPCWIETFDPQVIGESVEEYRERRRNTPVHLCRLRYFSDENRWSMAFYTYSHEKYEPCAFDNGTDHGTPEEAFDIEAVYLQG